jgi:sugar transferase EpsL
MTIKRIFDIAVSAAGLTALAPAFGAAVLMNTLKGRGSFYTVERTGKDGAPFQMFKFKTMNDARDPESGALLPDEQRLLKGTKWIRASGLDELPQLYNILKGDMSVVGPRPLSPSESREMTDMGFGEMFTVKPGLTGAWQTSAIGRRIEMVERGQIECAYVRSRPALRDDLKIIAATLPVFKYGHDMDTRNL